MTLRFKLKAPIEWCGDAMDFAKAHVHAGVLVIDDDGRIWRVAEKRRGGWVHVVPRRAENPGGKGYLRVSLGIPRSRALAIVMAHKLVYEVCVGRIPDGLEIDHKDNCKTNNHPRNLEPVTGLENMRRSHVRGRTKPWSLATKQEGRVWRDSRPILNEEQRQRAREMRASGEPLKRIAAALGIGISHAHRITSGGSP